MTSHNPPEEMNIRYRINKSEFIIRHGSILQVPTDILVSSDDNHLTMSGGVSRSILYSAGEIIREEARKHIPLKQLGDVAVTSAGVLSAKYIFHVVTIMFDDYSTIDEEALGRGTLRCLQLADTLAGRRIAFPALGTGAAGFATQRAAELMTRTISEYLLGATGIEQVILSLYPRSGFADNTSAAYARAASIAAMYTQSKRLGILLEELRLIVGGLHNLGITRQLEDFTQMLLEAQQCLLKEPWNSDDFVPSKTIISLNGVSQEIVAVSTNMQRQLSKQKKRNTSASGRLEAQILNTKLQGLQTQLNIQYGNLNRYEERKAKYGWSAAVPLELENAIEEVKSEIKQLEKKGRQVRQQLARIMS